MYGSMTRFVLVLVGVLFAASAAQASFTLADPPNVTTVDINSKGVTITQEAGNVTLAAYNALATTYTFTLDTTRTSETNTNLPAALTLTPGVSGIALNAQVTSTGTGYAVYASETGSQYSTSGSIYFAITRPTVEIAITQGVKGVAFTLNRLMSAATVKLYDSGNQAVGNAAGYTLSAGATSHGFFGFVGAAGDNPITKVVITYGGGGQFGVDDISFTNSPIPEPASLGLLGAGSMFLLRRRH